ncbi:MAG: ABC transporter substrate-binding protein [Kiritimatiellales bacterium]|nr:ABC transporter substrate-binding protein [Kiritimatiellales bacterium]
MNKKKALVLIAVAVVIGISVVLWRTKDDSAGGRVDIATILPLTGTAAELGRYNLNAASLFVDQANAKGEIKLRLNSKDSRSTAKDGLAALEAAYANSTPLAVMVHQGAVSVALAPAIAERGSIMFYIGATPEPKDVNPLAFRMYPDPKYVAERTVDQLLVPLALRKIAILWVNDEFGLAVAEAFRNRARASGVEIVMDEAYPSGTVDFRAILTKVREKGPQALYIVGVGAPLGRLISQSRQIGFQGRIVSGPEMQFSDVLGAAGDAAEGALFLDLAYDAASSKEPTKSFVDAYKQRYGVDPTSASAFVYDAWSILAEALSRAPDARPNIVADAILALRTFPGVCGQVEITEGRDFVFPMRVREIRGGKPQWYADHGDD